MNLSNALNQSVSNYKTLRNKLLEAHLDLVDDEIALLDTLEGITDTHEQLAALVRSAEEDEALAEGLKDYIDRMRNRFAWLLERAQKKKRVALNHMVDLGIPKITTPDMTISRRHVPPSVVIINEAEIPMEWMRVTYAPDKTLIKKALKIGATVPGCILGNGSETLAVKI